MGLIAVTVNLPLSPPTAHAATYSWQVGAGDWNIASNWGGTLPTSSDYAYIANGGTATISASSVCNTLLLGSGSTTSTVQMSGGSLASLSTEFVGYSGPGTFTQSGGTNNVTGSLSLGYSAGSSGLYNLGGGLLLAPAVSAGSGSSTFNFSGGTLRSTHSSTVFFGGLSTTYVQAGGAVVDSQSFDDTIGQSLLHDPSLGTAADGGLTKIGLGSITLAASNTFTGVTIIRSGAIGLSNALALQNSTFDTSGSGSLSFGTLTSATFGELIGTGSLSLSNLSNLGIALNLGGGNANTTYAGVLHGSGTLNKFGAGTCTLAGGPSTNSPTIVAAGGVVQVGGINAIAAATVTVNGGTLDVNGYRSGTVNVNLVNGSIVNSGGSAGALTPSGTFNAQSGSISASLGSGFLIKTTSGTVTLSGSNASLGKVTLNGGVLQVANSSALPFTSLNLFAGTLSSADTTGYTFSMSAISVSGAVTVGDPVTNGSLTLNGPAGIVATTQLTINSPVTIFGDLSSGGGTFTKAGGSLLSLGGADTTIAARFFSAVAVSGGTLQLNGYPAQAGNPQLDHCPSIAINNGGVLALNAMDVLGYQTGYNVLTINGGTVANITPSARVTIYNPLTMTGGLLTGSGSGDSHGVYSFYTGSFTATSDANGTPVVVNARNISLQNANLVFNVSRGLMNPASDLIISSVISEFYTGYPLGIVKAGNGVMTLIGSNVYIGGTSISGGTLALGNPLALQDSTLETSGSGSLSFGTLGSATFGGLSGPGALNLSNTASLAVALSAGNNGSSTTYSGALQGAGSLTKVGSGQLVLSGTGNSYSGWTFVTAGELIVTSAGGIPSGTALSVGSGLAVFGAPPIPASDVAETVPEPGTNALALVAALGVFAFVLWRCQPTACRQRWLYWLAPGHSYWAKFGFCVQLECVSSLPKSAADGVERRLTKRLGDRFFDGTEGNSGFARLRERAGQDSPQAGGEGTIGRR
jgi:autotransporter-associated beta strand protein